MEELEEKSAKIAKELSAQKGEKERLGKEKEELLRKCEEMQTEVIKLRTENSTLHDDTASLAAQSQKRILTLETTIHELESKLKTKDYKTLELEEKHGDADKRLQSLIPELERYKKIVLELEHENSVLKSANKLAGDENTKLNTQMAAAYKLNEEKLNELEQTCEKIRQQCEEMREEKSEYKAKTEELQKKVGEVEKERDAFREQFSKAKKTNKMMKGKMADIENEVKKYALERELEVQEVLRREELKKTKEMSKKTVLQEVQNQISQFKYEHKMKKTPNKSALS